MIESAGLDGSMRAVIVHSNLDKPRDVVLDPERGCVYYSYILYVVIQCVYYSYILYVIIHVRLLLYTYLVPFCIK